MIKLREIQTSHMEKDLRFADNDIAQSLAHARRKQEKEKQMGDMADQDIEQGQEQLWLHQTGRCGPDICQYCEAEDSCKAEELFNRVIKLEDSINLNISVRLMNLRSIIQNPIKPTDEEIEEWKQMCNEAYKTLIPNSYKKEFLDLCREIAALLENF